MISDLGSLTRTDHCGDLREEHIGRSVVVMGWVATRRNLGGMVFIDLRDWAGICQVVARPEVSPEAHEAASGVLVRVFIHGRATHRGRQNECDGGPI